MAEAEAALNPARCEVHPGLARAGFRPDSRSGSRQGHWAAHSDADFMIRRADKQPKDAVETN
jgi:hypothetical protein